MLKLALVLPIGFHGGTFRGLIHTALQLSDDAKFLNQRIVIDSWLPTNTNYSQDDLYELRQVSESIIRFSTETFLRQHESLKCSHKSIRFYGGHLNLDEYDFVLFISNTLEYHPTTRAKYGVKVYDFLQRRCPEAYPENLETWRSLAAAECVLYESEIVVTTTEKTKLDAINYAGVSPSKVLAIPEKIDLGWTQNIVEATSSQNYIHWATNGTAHKNHLVLISMFKVFLKNHPELKVIITGVETELFNQDQKSGSPYVAEVRKKIQESQLSDRFNALGNVSSAEYLKVLRGAKSHLQSSKYDNGSFTPVEATALGIPSTYGDYPQMVELANRFNIYGFAASPHDPYEIEKNLESTIVLPRRTPKVPSDNKFLCGALLLTIMESIRA
jgi:glycosyltransferase involved in cell wall biosynthesis